MNAGSVRFGGEDSDGATRRQRQRAALALAVVLCVHNAEEWLAYGVMQSRIEARLGLALPAPVQFQSALLIVTVLGAVVCGWTAWTRREDLASRVLALFALLLVVNVLVPHVPLAVLMQGYAPGVATAVLLNLPVGLLVLRALRKPVRDTGAEPPRA